MKPHHNVHRRMEKIRHGLRLHKLPKWARVLVISLAGGVCLALGAMMIFTPGPAFIFIPLGLFLLASEFKWAETWAQKCIDLFDKARARWRLWKKRRAAATKT